MQKFVKGMLCAAVLAFAITTTAPAHETFIKIKNTNPAKGEQVEGEILIGHVIIDHSEEVTKPESVDIAIVKDGKSHPASVTADAAAKLTRFTVKNPVEGTAWLTMHEKPRMMSQTPQGMQEGDRSTIKGDVIFTDKYEKCFKVLLNASASDTSYSEPLGHALEIVPLNNPADLKVGDELQLQILLNGKPVYMPLMASYDGFTDRENAWAYYITPENADDIYIKVHQPGFWVVMVRTRASGPKGSGIRNHHLVGTFEFEVK